MVSVGPSCTPPSAMLATEQNCRVLLLGESWAPQRWSRGTLRLKGAWTRKVRVHSKRRNNKRRQPMGHVPRHSEWTLSEIGGSRGLTSHTGPKVSIIAKNKELYTECAMTAAPGPS